MNERKSRQRIIVTENSLVDESLILRGYGCNMPGCDWKPPKDTEYFNRYGFSATAAKKLGNFEPAFRLSYSNYADDDVSDKSFMRYKASLKYDIPKCKLTPFVAAELFQQTDGGDLYKMRYSTGLDYKLFKNNYIGVNYKFDYYNTEYLNKHIISLGYKIKF